MNSFRFAYDSVGACLLATAILSISTAAMAGHFGGGGGFRGGSFRAAPAHVQGWGYGPVHGPGSSHNPIIYRPVHGPGSSHNPIVYQPVHGPGSSHNPIICRPGARPGSLDCRSGNGR